MNFHDYSLSEKILLAADHLEQHGETPFSAEALIVTAWKQFPGDFGLRGYADSHPDSNKVTTSIVGERGLVKRGWLVKKGQKLYALSRAGRQIVKDMTREEEWPKPLTAEMDNLIARLLESPVSKIGSDNRREELTYADACSFWDINPSVRGQQLQHKLHLFEMLKVGLAHVLHGGKVTLRNGRDVSADALTQLIEVHEHLSDRFGRQRDLLTSRSHFARR